MQELYLVKPKLSDETAVTEMMKEWRLFGGLINPGLLKRLGSSYSDWLITLDNNSKGINVAVPQTLYLMKNASGDVLGATSLRHYLNESNNICCGHVAYGIAPKYRNMGYGGKLLSLALAELKHMGIHRVLVTCNADNFASQGVILKNGGIFENHAYDEKGVYINRYWIENK